MPLEPRKGKKGEPETPEELRAAREAAWNKVAEHWEEMTDGYPVNHAANRHIRVQRESEAAADEMQERQLSAIPDPESVRRRSFRLGR